MIRYPLYVTIDTNIFDSTGYDWGDDGTLGHLCSYVHSGTYVEHAKEIITIDVYGDKQEIIEDCLEVLESFIDHKRI